MFPFDPPENIRKSFFFYVFKVSGNGTSERNQLAYPVCSKIEQRKDSSCVFAASNLFVYLDVRTLLMCFSELAHYWFS